MAGIRSSRGCKPCRRKKRGCDLSQPACGQCQKIGAKCVYEGRIWTFVPQQQHATTHQPPPRTTPANLVSHSLLLADRRRQLETAYLQAYLPCSESPTDTASTISVVGTWIPTICYLASTDRVARLAFDSCILMALGQMQSNLDFINHGMAMYCQALSKTNQALQHAATAQTDATLATCVILAMCEMYRPRAGSEVSTHALDFQRHVQGTARLLELRGSQRHVQEHGFTLFANARSIIAHSGITQGQRTFLDSDQWFEVPWSMQDRERSLKDRLVDVMLAVTASLEQLDRRRSQSSYEDQHTEEALTASVTSCLASLQLLQAWEAKVLKSSAHARLEDVCAKQGFGTFHLVMSYWAVSLILSARCWPVLACIGEHTPALEALVSSLSSPQTCFVNIANHAHRYFPLSTGLVGPHQATFPLGTALNFINAWETADTVEREQPGVDSMYGQEDMRKAVAKMKTLFYTDERARGTAELLNYIGLQKT